MLDPIKAPVSGSPTPTPKPTPSPTPTPTPPPTGTTLKARYRTNDTNATNNEAKPVLQLVNTGTAPVSLASAKVRYYLTRDGGSSTINSWCDWAQIGCAAVTRTIGTIAPARPAADRYLEVGFTGGTLAPGASTGDVQLRLAKSDWSPFNEADDYSRGTNTAHIDWTRVAVFAGGIRVWGTSPPG